MNTSPRVCRDCGASIADRAPQARRCERCARAAKHRAPTPGPRLCLDCRASIAHRQPMAKRCEPCAAAAIARAKADDHANAEERPYACDYCGTVFARRRSDTRFCRHRCWQLFHLEQRRSERPDYLCGWCGKAFRPVRSDAVNCSPGCSSAAWYAGNAEHVKAHSRAWLAANPEGRRAISATDKARRRGAGGPGVGARDWRRLVARYRGCCAYCGVKPEALHMEHVVPLVRGGRHAIGNVLPACPRCNLSKHSKLVVEWRRRQRREAIGRAVAHRPDPGLASAGAG